VRRLRGDRAPDTYGELAIHHEDTLVVTVASGVERTGWEQTVFLRNRSSLLGREWSFQGMACRVVGGQDGAAARLDALPSHQI
jgi:hypothetical protein